MSRRKWYLGLQQQSLIEQWVTKIRWHQMEHTPGASVQHVLTAEVLWQEAAPVVEHPEESSWERSNSCDVPTWLFKATATAEPTNPADKRKYAAIIAKMGKKGWVVNLSERRYRRCILRKRGKRNHDKMSTRMHDVIAFSKCTTGRNSNHKRCFACKNPDNATVKLTVHWADPPLEDWNRLTGLLHQLEEQQSCVNCSDREVIKENYTK